MNQPFWFLLLILSAGIALSIFTKKLTVMAALTGGIIAVCVYAGAGFTGIFMMAAFFLMGTLATSWQVKKKKAVDISEKNDGQRKASQVVANAGMAAMHGLAAFVFPQHSVLLGVMMAASFSSATADTLSSELGNVYGRRFYNILSFKKDKRGLDGVISLEGTLAGICGSVVIGFIYLAGFGWNGHVFWIVLLSGTIGNLSDSLLGAAFERKGFLRNDMVNFLNTLVASLAAWLFYKV